MPCAASRFVIKDSFDLQLTKSFRVYRQNLLHTQKFSEVFQLANGGSYVFELAMSILYIFGAIRLEGLLSALCCGVALASMVFAVGLVNTLAEVNQGSRHVLRQLRIQVAFSLAVWRRSRLLQYHKKYLRRLPELRIHFGSICPYDKKLVLITFHLVVVYSATLLLTI